MSRAVEHVLAQRARRTGRRPEAASLIAALALHGLVVAAAWALPRLQEPPKPPEYMPVTIIPAQALGVPRPAPPRPRPAPPAPEPVVAEPEPAPTPEPEPEPPAPEPEDVPVLPKKEPEKKPEKKPEPSRATETGRKPPETPKKPEPRRPTPSQTTAAGTGEPEDRGDQTGRRGAATGNPLGTTAFGSEIAGLDNPDFTYGYYLDRLLSLINDKWERPSLGSGIRAIISFRIERDGRMTDLRVSESSGYNTFDLAAMRAVQNASPFPPLPRAYRHDSLGVNLIVR